MLDQAYSNGGLWAPEVTPTWPSLWWRQKTTENHRNAFLKPSDTDHECNTPPSLATLNTMQQAVVIMC